LVTCCCIFVLLPHLVIFMMKAIYFLPAGLLLFLCILNFYLGIITKPDNGFIVYLVFGAVYLALGVLLISRFRFAEILGIVITLSILLVYPVLVGFQNMHPWTSGLMGGIDAIVFICCLILLMLKIKS
jgi:hypothetical protein